MQTQKQIHVNQLWQQGLSDVILKSCDTTVLKTLPLFNVKCFCWWVCKHETISTKKFAFLIVTLWTRNNSVFGHFSRNEPSVDKSCLYSLLSLRGRGRGPYTRTSISDNHSENGKFLSFKLSHSCRSFNLQQQI